MEKFKELDIPEQIFPDALQKIVKAGENSSAHRSCLGIRCDDIDDCDKCILGDYNFAILKEYVDQPRAGKWDYSNLIPSNYLRWSKHDDFIKKENKMKKCISENYDKTADALLVEKWMSSDLTENFLTQLVVSDHKEKILAEAKRRGEEAKETNKD